MGRNSRIASAAPSALPPDLSELDDRDWAEARRRLDLIGPVLKKVALFLMAATQQHRKTLTMRQALYWPTPAQQQNSRRSRRA
jgi:hypothetical protein